MWGRADVWARDSICYVCPFGLYFLHSGPSWAVLSLSSNEDIFLIFLGWAATLPRYGDLVDVVG